MNISHTIQSLQSGKTLSGKEAFDLQSSILKGEMPTASLVEIFTAFQGRKISEAELGGFFKASQEAMTTLATATPTLDTCGTGGDNSGSFNISTVAGLVCSAGSVSVAKHGNRAASSKCGSADVLEALGVKIELSPEQAKNVLEQCEFVFLFARSYHPAFKHAGEARKLFGKKTYFNLLGPLLNPAKAEYRVHGLADFSFAETLGNLLVASGVKKAWLVHAEDGLDEVSPFSDTQVLAFEKGKAKHSFTINPKEFSLAIEDRSSLAGGDAKQNAGILSAILKGKGTSAQNSAVILNAAAGFTVYGMTKEFAEGVKLATNILASGKGYEKLQEVIKATNEVSVIPA